MDMKDRVALALTNAMEMIEKEDYNAAISALNDVIEENPSAVDARMIAEVKLIEKLISYKKDEKIWEYLKNTKVIYEYCEKQFFCDKKDFTYEELPDKDVIWCCWFQGMDNAPDIIQICVESLKRFGREVRVLTDENYAEYVTLPEIILKKRKEGIISNTHFSDLLRVGLLAERGGLWIDATVYCSDPDAILEVLKETDLFAYSFAMRVEPTRSVLFDSWFLYAAKKNPIIESTKNMLWKYWQEEDYLLHYYLFHLCFSVSCRRYPLEWEKIPVYSMEPCHIMQQEMLGEYRERRWKQILGMSGIHKLTYKYDSNQGIEGTMLEYLLHNA